jgi:hypothetical protein
MVTFEAIQALKEGISRFHKGNIFLKGRGKEDPLLNSHEGTIVTNSPAWHMLPIGLREKS